MNVSYLIFLLTCTIFVNGALPLGCPNHSISICATTDPDCCCVVISTGVLVQPTCMTSTTTVSWNPYGTKTRSTAKISGEGYDYVTINCVQISNFGGLENDSNIYQYISGSYAPSVSGLMNACILAEMSKSPITIPSQISPYTAAFIHYLISIFVRIISKLMFIVTTILSYFF